jgi:hypothetical protein
MFNNGKGNSWPDKVGEKFNSNITDLNDKKITTIKSSVVGNFKHMIDNTNSIKAKISDYNAAKSARSSYISQRSQFSPDKGSIDGGETYRYYTGKISAEEQKMEAALREINSLISNYPKYTFEGSNGSGGLSCYNFGYAAVYSDNAYVMSGSYSEDGSEQNARFNNEEYQRAIDERRDIIMADGDELVFAEGFIGIGRDTYFSSNCVTMYIYDSSTGMYRAGERDASGNVTYYNNPGPRTPAQMRSASHNWK